MSPQMSWSGGRDDDRIKDGTGRRRSADPRLRPARRHPHRRLGRPRRQHRLAVRPRFDSEPLFARLIGGPDAGHFRMGPANTSPPAARHYRPGTATIETSWRVDGGQLTLTEAMVAEVASPPLPATTLVRRLSVHGAPTEAVIEFQPRRGERRQPPRVARRVGVLVCSWPTIAIALR